VSKARPPVVRLSDLAAGKQADCFAQLAERARNATRDGKPFFNCRFRDARRTLSAVVWSDSPQFAECERDWEPGRCYKLRVTLVESERYGPQLEIHQIRPASDADRADGFDPLDLVERSRFDPPAMLAELRALVEAEIAGEPLRRLTVELLNRHANALVLLPGSPKHYHPFAGGWVEHTLSVAKSCVFLVDKYKALYPELTLNRDLVLAGAVLHDIGRVDEVDDPLGGQPSVPGRLLGHITLGRDLVRAAAREIPELDAELLLLLDHLILSHLTLPEWGSPRLPAIPECLILHHADDLDAKLEMYARCLQRDQAPGPFTDRDPVLGKPLLKGRKT